MRRRLINLVASITIAAGGWLLLSTPLGAETAQDTCTAPSGASCSGDTCCADATGCYTDPAICTAMFCTQHPTLPACQG